MGEMRQEYRGCEIVVTAEQTKIGWLVTTEVKPTAEVKDRLFPFGRKIESSESGALNIGDRMLDDVKAEIDRLLDRA